MSALSYLKAEALSLEGCNGKRWKPCGQLLCFSILYFSFSSASFCVCFFLRDGRWEMSEERLRSLPTPLPQPPVSAVLASSEFSLRKHPPVAFVSVCTFSPAFSLGSQGLAFSHFVLRSCPEASWARPPPRQVRGGLAFSPQQPPPGPRKSSHTLQNILDFGKLRLFLLLEGLIFHTISLDSFRNYYILGTGPVQCVTPGIKIQKRGRVCWLVKCLFCVGRK